MSGGCLFCRIAAGSERASTVYEDDVTLAFMNIRQANPGHVLVVPKRHAAAIYDLDDATAARLIQTVVRVARAVRESLEPDGLNVLQFNDEAGGQDILHVHFHVLPRRRDDGLMKVYEELPPEADRAALDALAARIATQL